MRKLILALVILVTAGNLAGAVYAAVCESKGGSRACGHTCVVNTDGSCQCEGSCSSGELKWVDGGGGAAAAMEELAN
jgi:hypothetical protein